MEGTYIDKLFLEFPSENENVLTAVQEFERRYLTPTTPTTNATSTTTRYAFVKNEDEIVRARKAAVPKKTQDDTQWCLRIWNDWSQQRNLTFCDDAGQKVLLEAELATSSKCSLARSLERFVLEIRNKHGQEYCSNTLHHIVCGIMRYIRCTQAGIDFFTDVEFTDFIKTLDGKMKLLQKKGIGGQVKKAEVITEDEEELLWSEGLLGDHNPQALLNTVFFMSGLFFALRSGGEHRNLRLDPPQVVVRESGKVPHLQYTEDMSKNHPGGLKHRKVVKKEVKHFANVNNPERCFVRIYKLYLSKLSPCSPQTAFYFKPLLKWSPSTIWFSKQPIGHNTLNTMMSKLCLKAGIKGFKTNHSLRATAASRLYHHGIDEQLIMERTGHRSIDGVRSYKRTNEEQQLAVSSSLQQTTSTPIETPFSVQPQAVESHNGQPSATQSLLSAGLQLYNCSGITITINNNTV